MQSIVAVENPVATQTGAHEPTVVADGQQRVGVDGRGTDQIRSFGPPDYVT
jgi:hypothetical protein